MIRNIFFVFLLLVSSYHVALSTEQTPDNILFTAGAIRNAHRTHTPLIDVQGSFIVAYLFDAATFIPDDAMLALPLAHPPAKTFHLRLARSFSVIMRLTKTPPPPSKPPSLAQ